MTSEQLLNKWQQLDTDEQEKVLAYIKAISEKKLSTNSEGIYQPQTELGKKLWELRLKSLGKQPLLNTWEEVEQELAQRRGNVQQ